MPRTRTKVGKLALVPNDELCLMWSTVEYVGCGAHGRVDRAPWDRDRRPVPKPGRFWTNFRALRVRRQIFHKFPRAARAGKFSIKFSKILT